MSFICGRVGDARRCLGFVLLVCNHFCVFDLKQRLSSFSSPLFTLSLRTPSYLVLLVLVLLSPPVKDLVELIQSKR